MIDKYNTHKQWNISRKEEWNLAICDNMDGLREYYAKWNKSEKKQILYNLLKCGIQKKQNKWTNITKEKQNQT